MKGFECEERLLPETYLVVRIDGRGFTKFCQNYKLRRPLDDRMINLMAASGIAVMEDFSDIIVGFGESDEFSFVFSPHTVVYNRRRDKIVSTVVSLFTAAFVFNWPKFFVGDPLVSLPSFDSRAVLYPSKQIVRDYLSWRQADTHINCLYNYTLCCLLDTGVDPTTATERLRGTFTNDKNEILFAHGINYNSLPFSHKKGTVLVRDGKVKQIEMSLIDDAFWEVYGRLFD